jgi:hypothetical protein
MEPVPDAATPAGFSGVVPIFCYEKHRGDPEDKSKTAYIKGSFTREKIQAVYQKGDFTAGQWPGAVVEL